MHRSTKHRRLLGLKKLFSLQVVIILLASSLVASAPPFQENWDWFGKYKLLSSSDRLGRILRVNTQGQGLLYKFLRLVGGIMFEQTAKPAPSLAGKKISLKYNPKRADRSRLVITVGGRKYYPDLADWMLIPTARYADSEYTALVALMDPIDKTIDMHSDLKNTLLGMRLIQQDMLMIDPKIIQQFPNLGGRVILGEGESLPDEAASSESASELETIRQQAEGKWSALLITDEGVDITFSVSGGDFKLTGDFYYYFWDYDYGDGYREADQKYREQVVPLWENYFKLKEQGKQEEALNQIKQIRAVKRPEYKEAYRKYAEQKASLLDRSKALDEEGKLKEAEDLRRQADELEAPITEIRPLIDALEDNKEARRKLNPQLYKETTDTMRYAALFRYVKATNPQSWKAFCAQLRGRVPKPSVITPYAWQKAPGN